MPKQVYIGLVQVIAHSGSKILEKGEIGFTNVVALAENVQDFVLKVKKMTDYYSLILINVEDIEFLLERMKIYEVSVEIIELANNLNEKMDWRVGTFYTWKSNKKINT